MKISSLSIVFFSIMIDQVTKRAVQHIGYLKIFDSLFFVPSWNKGVSFSFLSSVNSTLLTLALIAVCIYVGKLLYKNNKVFEKIGLAMILGGGIGNLIDRFIYGKVFDFLLIKHNSWQFAIFNMADSFITVGALILFIDLLKKPGKKKSEKVES